MRIRHTPIRAHQRRPSQERLLVPLNGRVIALTARDTMTNTVINVPTP